MFSAAGWPQIRAYLACYVQLVSLDQGFSTFSKCQNHLEDSLNTVAGPGPQSFQFSKSGLGLRIYISHKFPGDANAPGLGTILGEPLP